MTINKSIRYISIFLFSLLLSTASWAQETTAPVEMATQFYGEGKIYIVIAVMLIIFSGIVVYLINLDKKISKLEKDNH